MNNLIPQPKIITSSTGSFNLTNKTRIVTPENTEIAHIVEILTEHINNLAGFQLEMQNGETASKNNSMEFSISDDANLGDEEYKLSISSDEILLQANFPAGIFYGVQTLIQLLGTPQDSTFNLPALSITDSPRYLWRGAMLDVARHFFSVDDVKRCIDLISHYKMNRLHLHLSDDQGWRIEIKSWPNLTKHGAKTQVNGGGGGFYTQEQYKEIVEYARSRYIMIIPEIDTPGHTIAALASYAELNCDDKAPDLYEGIEVGLSSLCIHKEITYKFLDDVFRELAAITPGPCIHIGGDEARSTAEEDYKLFIRKMQEIVYSHNKTPIGWSEIGEAKLNPNTIVQHWQGAAYQEAKKQGCKIIISPANKTYLDIKYDETTPLGLTWVGYISVKDSYDWEPGSYMTQLEESDILGIESPLWSETLLTMKDIEFMAFPRLPGLAELAWSPKGQSWDEYKTRLAKHGRHFDSLNINFFRSPDVDWE